MNQCRGVIATHDPNEPIARCGAQSDRSYCRRCADDPAQTFWSEVLRSSWDRDLTPTVNQLLSKPPLRVKPKPKPAAKPSIKRKKPPHKALMSREEARKVLLGG